VLVVGGGGVVVGHLHSGQRSGSLSLDGVGGIFSPAFSQQSPSHSPPQL
jgi:hypothetical protein